MNCIGNWAVVLHDNRLVVGTVMDCVAGTSMPKRIRIQRGDLQGQVLQPAQYQFKQWLKDDEIDP